MGGQVADHGQILDAAGNLVATVTDVQKAPNKQNLLQIKLEQGVLKEGMTLHQVVDSKNVLPLQLITPVRICCRVL